LIRINLAAATGKLQPRQLGQNCTGYSEVAALAPAAIESTNSLGSESATGGKTTSNWTEHGQVGWVPTELMKINALGDGLFDIGPSADCQPGPSGPLSLI